MEIYFLGTGAGMPSKERNVTAIALNLLAETGSWWLFDCGEGTQQQILHSPVKLSKTDKLFITHLHGDHIYGLPGLLTSRSNQGGETPFSVYGPAGIREFIETALSVSQARLGYELHITEIEEGEVLTDGQFNVTAGRLDHRIACLGYRIAEKAKPGQLDAAKLRELNVSPGPVYAELKQGRDVRLADGRLLHGKDFIGPEIPGRTVTILGDTRYCRKAVELSGYADAVVHEATFAAGEHELAGRFYHSTALDAARVAAEAEAKMLIMTHISSRYQGSATNRLKEEAETLFPLVQLADDFASFPVFHRPQVEA